MDQKKAETSMASQAKDGPLSTQPNRKKKFSWDDIKTVFFPALFLSFTFFVFGPLQLYITNAEELFFSVGDIWWLCGIAGVILCGLLTGLGLLLGKKLGAYYSCVLWGIALGLYIQGNYIPTSYSTTDGSVDWSQYSGVAVWNTAIWIVCLVLPFLLNKLAPKLWKGCRSYISLGIVAVQVLTLGTLFLTADLSQEVEWSLTNQGKFELSSKHNIIVFIVDAYDSQYFADFIEKNPEYKETIWSDFTFYPDTAGVGARTYLALPQILTGKAYTDENRYFDYLKDGYDSTSLYQDLYNAGYNIGIYTNGEYVLPELDEFVLNISTSAKKIESYPTLAYYLFRFTACRYFPHVLKSAVWTYAEDFDKAVDNSGSEESAYLWNDALFYQTLVENGISVQDEENVFRIYHLVGAHTPYVLTEQCERDFAGTSLEEQQKGVMTLLGTYFAQMQQLGIYDDADIVVMADHGDINKYQNPLLLIKHGTETDSFVVSDIPVSYENLHSTFLSFALQNSENGKSILDLTENDNLQRNFYLGNGNTATEYVIQGNAADPQNIHATGKAFSIYETGTDKIEKYQLNSVSYFNLRGEGQQYIVEGFGVAESTHTWTVGNRAVLRFPLEKPLSSDVFVSISLAKFQGDMQHIGVYINDVFLNCYAVNTDEFKFIIPAEMVENAELTIRLELPDAVETVAESFSDSRLMSLAFKSMVISERQPDDMESFVIPAYSLGSNIVFTEEDDGCRYFPYGISHVEANFAWTSGKSSQMMLLVEDSLGDLTGEFQFMSVFLPPQRLIVRCRDNVLYDNEVSSSAEVIRFTVPEDCVKDGWLQLELEYPNADSPANFGTGGDVRTLAFAFKNVRFYPADK